MCRIRKISSLLKVVGTLRVPYTENFILLKVVGTLRVPYTENFILLKVVGTLRVPSYI